MLFYAVCVRIQVQVDIFNINYQKIKSECETDRRCPFLSECCQAFLAHPITLNYAPKNRKSKLLLKKTKITPWLLNSHVRFRE